MITQGNYIKIGEIYREHGVSGGAKVYLYSNNTDNFRKGMTVLLQKNGVESKEAVILKVEVFKKWYLTRFSVFCDSEETRKWRKAAILVDRKDLAKTKTKEHYLFELIGFEIHNQHRHLIGRLEGMQGEGDSEIFVVKNENGGEVLVPAVPEWIKRVDKEEKKIIMELPEELI